MVPVSPVRSTAMRKSGVSIQRGLQLAIVYVTLLQKSTYAHVVSFVDQKLIVLMIFL